MMYISGILAKYICQNQVFDFKFDLRDLWLRKVADPMYERYLIKI